MRYEGKLGLSVISHLSLGEQNYIQTRHKDLFRGTQRQFSENICSEDDLRSRIFGTFVVKFLVCLPLLYSRWVPLIYNELINSIREYGG